jgi:hypothetical protein
MRLWLAMALLISFSSSGASLGGTVIDLTGAVVSHAYVELDSGARKYKGEANDTGVYEFLNLPAGEYTLTFRVPGFRNRRVKSIGLLESEQKRIPDIPLDIAPCGSPSREIVLLPPGDDFGRLSGTVLPAVSGIEVTLVCRTFSACGSTKTDSEGHFSFSMLSAGYYGLNFRLEGFYPENATGYSYDVSAGWESIYDPKSLERCPNGNCDPKLRPPPKIQICE